MKEEETKTHYCPHGLKGIRVPIGDNGSIDVDPPKTLLGRGTFSVYSVAIGPPSLMNLIQKERRKNETPRY
tara:strand:+ start:123 stop:335 length:213 start_codon:yes stop_codon:yes gene_type:complete